MINAMQILVGIGNFKALKQQNFVRTILC